MAQQFLSDKNGWLSFNHSTPILYITAEDDDFDPETLRAWRDEGFIVKYIPQGTNGKAYVNTLHKLGDGLGIGERYAVVAFGDAAAVCLNVFAEPKTATSKLCSLVAYYPTSIPDPHRRMTASFRVVVHLALGRTAPETIDVVRRPEVLGIQARRKLVTKRVTPGIGVGGLLAKMAYPVYTYAGVDAGFAEHDLEQYDGVADAVAWGRSVDVVRRGFGAEVGLERVWEENMEQKFHTHNPQSLMKTYTTSPPPSVTFTPTMTGGSSHPELTRFYTSFFPSPPSLHIRLLSRTIGATRIVDELYLSFRHTCAMPWILPDVPPTNEKVEVVVVWIAGMKAGRVESERVYWDQASVLFQVGLLDGEDVAGKFRDKGVEMLPVCGSEAARKAVDVGSEEANFMIGDW